MSDTAEYRVNTFNWFTPSRFAVLLALLVFASFPQVLLGVQTFIARDYGFFAYPLAYFQKQCFWHGEIPFWDPYNNCGIPFLAQWNTMPLYPPALIYLLLPLSWSLSFFCLLHLWFGGLGMYFLARRWTANDFAAAFAGTAFSFSGMSLNLLMWPSHTATWAWMPWVVLTVEAAWRCGGRRIAVAAICGALQMLAGGPEIIFFTWSILFALWIVEMFWAWTETAREMLQSPGADANHPPDVTGNPLRARTIFWRFPAVVALVGLMAAAQLLPFLDLAANSQRQAGYADLRWSMPGHGWANYLVPMAFGAVRGEGIFFQVGQAWTSSYYLGIGTLWLGLLAIWKCRDRRVWPLAAVIVVGVICALGENTPIFPAIRTTLPQLAFVTYPVKYLLLVTFAAPLLAAFALVRIREQKRALAIIGPILLGLMVAVIVWLSQSSMANTDAHTAILNGFSRIVVLGVTGLALAFVARNPGTLRIAPLLLIVVAWLDVLTHEPAQNPTVQSGIYQPDIARQQLAMDPQPELGGPRAMVSPKAFMQFIQLALRSPEKNYLAKRLGYCADCNLLDGVPKVEGFFSLTPRQNDALISLIYGATNDFPRLDDFIGISQITAPDEIYHWLPRKTYLPLVTAGQKPFIMDDWNTLQLLKDSNFDGNKFVFLGREDKQLVTVTNFVPAARILDSKFQNSGVDIDVDSPAPTIVVVAQTFYHNWRASVDGQRIPLLRANHAFQAVEVPQGSHKIVLRYVDHAFELGAGLSFMTWVGCVLVMLISKQRE